MLSALGIDEHAEAVYRLMLDQPDWGVVEIAEHMGLTETGVRSALDRLAELNLLRTSLQTEGSLRPINPAVGISLLLAEQERQLRCAQQQFVETQAAALRLLDEYAAWGAGRHDVEQLIGIDAIQDRLEQLAHDCTTRVLSFMPGGAQSAASLEASRPLDQAALGRGVALLTLYQDSVRNDPATLAYARWLTRLGGQVRTVPVLPIRMVLFDDATALLPVDPDNTRKGAVQLSGPGVITALVALFDAVWQRAAPFGTDRDRELNDAGLTGQEVELLRLLSQGLTDEIAARRLGIGLRTVRRMMSDLMGRLGARSRFEAGVRAAQRGWLD
ncbi:helix-turn-helix transcriptional regulator [Streptomyces piniterrae]|uniref:Helix-turn-helix transcriptional regulator n=1 Tax=Streptomyces piniterrae TaxID=2571125 RepID=A0A4U0NV97_9ACTN|nr:helix-turn-helix transcriptional regulator [Streptomyces piniterrae]TJZ54164.1 helix-turn-helix transcriptional regulator [Streptomyces piniterrae]